eukprot:TRINITY_DN12922_c0_g2_i2.p1 TRINITY_DN12922_c0_g2~~TRINITY_DN12922_c0_g2_i2.p1  ORF type:complete len:391 (+),score=97.24 TRINITY_DN12922_c0_g2_i2:216-1388(+)
MARKVGKGSKKPRSTAKRLAQKSNTVRILPQAKRDFIIDDRPSQYVKGRPEPRAADMAKGKYETIPGTRIQPIPGRGPIRVVIQDGKQFEPRNVRGARRHLAKLADEAAELARIQGSAAVAEAAAATVAKAAAAAAKTIAERRSQLIKHRLKEGQSQELPPSKKERKAAARHQRQAELDALHADAADAEERQPACDVLLLGEVMERRAGQALLRLSAESAKLLPEAVALALQQRTADLQAGAQPASASAESAESAGTGSSAPMLLSLRYGDAKDLNLQVGTSCRFKIFTSSKSGTIGAYEAQPFESPSFPKPRVKKVKVRPKVWKADANEKELQNVEKQTQEQRRALRASKRDQHRLLAEAKSKRAAALARRASNRHMVYLPLKTTTGDR